jgi:hypothetical protein
LVAKAVARRPASKAGAAPPSPPPAAAPDPDDPDFIRLVPSDDEARVPLFSIGDREFTILARPRPNIGLKYLRISRKPVSKGGGEQAATDYLLTALLGEEGYEALTDFDELTSEQFAKVLAIASKVAFGALEVPKL